MKKLVIDRKVWLRGDARNSVLLRQQDQKQCCVGIYAEACGVPRSSLMSVLTYRKLPQRPDEMKWLLGRTADGVGIDDLLYNINDMTMAPRKRETQLAEAFKRYGNIEVEFID